jgi:hypothetical protein
LNNKELFTLEKLLCSSEEPGDFRSSGQSVEFHESAELIGTTNTAPSYPTVPDLDDFVTRFYIDYPNCKQFVTDFYASTSSRNVEGENQNTFNSGGNENVSRIEFCASVSDTLRTEDEAKVGDSEVVPSWEGTEESEDETEYVGEISECETVVTGAYNEAEEVMSSVESDSKTSVSLPEDFSAECNHPGLSESLVFREHKNTHQQSASISSSSSCASHPDFQTQVFESARLTASSSESQYSESCGHLPYSDTIKIPTPGVSGFLLANQVGHDSMLASMERITNPIMPDLSPGAGGSLPDGDSHEALSVATATLSTLLLSSPNVSPVGDTLHDIEEDPCIQSPLDSGVGTVVSCSDTGSFSDRSPDTASAPTLVSSETKVTDKSSVSHIATQTFYDNAHKSEQPWQVKTIPCNCTLSDRPGSSSSSNRCVNRLQNSSTDPYSRVSVKTGGGSCQNADVHGCSLTVVTLFNNICDSTFGDSGRNFVACQDCLLPIEVENLDKGDPVSSDVESSKVLSEEGEECTNFMPCGENKSDRVLYNEATLKNFSPVSSSFQNSSQETSVPISHNVYDFNYGAVNVSSAALYNTNVPQEFEQNINDANGGKSCERTVGHINDVPVRAFQLNGSHKDMVIMSNEGHEQNKTLPCIVVKMEGEQDKGGEEEWLGVADVDGECTLCSSTDAIGAQSQTAHHLLNYEDNQEHCMVKQQSEAHDSCTDCSVPVTSHLEQESAERAVRENKKVFLQASSSKNVASSLPAAGDTNYQPGGSTLVPSQSGR